MDIYKHSISSAHKFGGVPEDYYAIHKFIDSSKFFYHHVKHRLLLHNLYGVELAVDLFGDTIKNKESKIVLVRDIVCEHLKEDLSGHVPTLHDWLIDNDKDLSKEIVIPEIPSKELEAFVFRPYLMSGLQSALLITLSDFGISLCENLLGIEQAKALVAHVNKNTVKHYLEQYTFSKRWQYTPDQKTIQWLKQQQNGTKSIKTRS